MLDGGLLLAARDGLWRFDTRTGARSPHWRRRPTTRTSSASTTASATRRAVSGSARSMSRATPPGQRFVSLSARHADARCADGITTSNGLAWSPDGRTMYWSDTKAHVIYAFDFDALGGTLSGRRVFCQFPVKPAGPTPARLRRPPGRRSGRQLPAITGSRCSRDSACCVCRPAGQLLREIPLPVRCPTMPCFGGYRPEDALHHHRAREPARRRTGAVSRWPDACSRCASRCRACPPICSPERRIGARQGAAADRRCSKNHSARRAPQFRLEKSAGLHV